mgnify:CR=1 FL=1
MNLATEAPEWVSILSGCALSAYGISVAAIVLVPSAGNFIFPQDLPARPGSTQLVSTLPDRIGGVQDLRYRFYVTHHGLEQLELQASLEGSNAEDFLLAKELSRSLVEISGLSVSDIAEAVGVSRTTYHHWLNGEGMSDKHLARVKTLEVAIRALRDIRGTDLRDFLLDDTPAGRPLTLLASGDIQAVIGLALLQHSERTVTTHVVTTARQVSGILGWLRPVRRRGWIASSVPEDELYQAVARLSPPSVMSDPDAEAWTEADDASAYSAYGFIPE